MAGQASTDGQFNPYLSSTQQDLLLAALASNSYGNSNGTSNGNGAAPAPRNNAIKRSDSDPSRDGEFVPPSFVDGGLFDTTQQTTQPPNEFGPFGFDDTSPFIDYLDGDTSLNFDSNDLGGEDMFGGEPGPRTESSESDKGDKTDKRKSPDDADDDEEDDPKRREGDDKTAKKPGRKPLTSEPTTKRKAQNRAAQRAFRERKEKHLKDLETKVDSLTKAQEADKQENGMLRAQVERLQMELRDYKKRMSMNSTGISQSPPSSTRMDARSNSKTGSDFQFEFPTFGNLPASQFFNTHTQPKRNSVNSPVGGVAPNAQLPRQNSQGRYPSPPKTQSSSSGQTPASHASSRTASLNAAKNMPSIDGFNSTLPQMSPSLFTPSVLNPTTTDYGLGTTASPHNIDNGGDSNSGISRAFRFNSGSASSKTASPSVSSLSQFNPNSSCGTSPESAHDSPSSELNKANGTANTYSFNSNPTNQNAFSTIANTNTKDNNTDFNFDWLATQNGGQFDPVLFGDYRDSQDAVVGDGDFNNGFFNDAFPYDFGSPNLNFNFNSPKPQQQQIPAQASRNLLAEVEKAREGGDDDYPGQPAQTSTQVQNHNAAVQKLSQEKNVPIAQAEKMLNCNTIWSQLQSNPDFQDGKFDLDGLCAELRAKAKCSESGVTVPSDQVDAAFKKLSGNKPPQTDLDNHHYVFERESVDEAIRRLGGNQ